MTTRNEQFDDSMKVMQLRRLLKRHEIKTQTEKILTTTGSLPNSDALNQTHFKPVHRPADQWGDAFHVK